MVEALAARLDQLEAQLNQRVTPMSGQIADLQTKLDDVTRELKDHIDAFRVVDSTVTANQAVAQPALEEIPKLIDALRNAQVEISQVQIESGACTSDIKDIKKALADADQEFKRHQQWSQTNVGQLSSRLDSIASSTSPGGAGGFQRKLDEHRAFEKYQKANGLEPMADLVDWFDRIIISVNSVIPGSLEVRKQLRQKQDAIDANYFQNVDPTIAHRLNSELYSLFAGLFMGKAWTFLKAKPENQGLEAFRYSYINLTKQTQQQLLNEHKHLNAPDGPKSVSESYA